MNTIHITKAGKNTAGSTLARSVSRITAAAVLFTSISCTGGNPSLNGNLTFGPDGGIFPDGQSGVSDGNMPVDMGAGGRGGAGGSGGSAGMGGTGGHGGSAGMGGSDATFADARPSDSTVHPDAKPSDATPKPDSRPSDAIVRPDASPSDARVSDARPSDARAPDAVVESDALGTPDAHPADAGRADAARNDAARPDAVAIPDEGTPDARPSDASPPDAEPDSSFADCVSDESCENIHEICVEEHCVLAPVTCEDDPQGEGATLRQGRWSEFFFNICQGASRLLARCFGDHIEDVEEQCAEGEHCEDQGQGVLACVPGTPDAGVADAGRSDAEVSDATSDGPLDGTPDARIVRDATADARADGTPDATRLDASRADAARPDAAADAAVDASPDAMREDAAVTYNFCTSFDSDGHPQGISRVHSEPFVAYLESDSSRFRDDHGSGAPNPTYVAVVAYNSPSNPLFSTWFQTQFGAYVGNEQANALPYLLVADPSVPIEGHSVETFSRVPLARFISTQSPYQHAVAVSDISQGVLSNGLALSSSWAQVAAYIRNGNTIAQMELDPGVIALSNTEAQLIQDSGLHDSLPAAMIFNRVTGECGVFVFLQNQGPTQHTREEIVRILSQ